MTALVVQRFRECQNLLDSVVTNLCAIENFTSQRSTVEEAARRLRSSTSVRDAAVPLCCTDPLGMLAVFPESAVELIIAQHDDDTAALLRSLNSTQQMWGKKLQQAKEALQSGESGKTEDANVADKQRDVSQVICTRSFIAVLSQMHGWLRALILALRADLANPPRAVKLSEFLSAHDPPSKSDITPVVIVSLEAALGQLPDRVRREWELCTSQHMVDEAWVMLLS
ncbi:hypothetical protein, conserved [Trypanosoma brucei gambiense DAL972]|uniref:Uncharacterized protein n=1 Tax=Trypanosoma brucei gambiense (strain MHOM/CI/86/DAL972) TaxID=679716 RepID=D0A530_TRYB9|nr:hypothetical protein, conserved [Trypanosoma brucei gambiense DAL972]CBH16374.1 hypothetical protein, conserved [Trypanosoma brucei gambiense DAL972]|eukprot:XP_011778638.1 hypothetical protein, conserved [Trypanosoma brucei gambiense DAL972]